MLKNSLLLLLFVCNSYLFSQTEKFTFKKALKEQPNTIIPFCLANNNANIALLEREGVKIKYSTKNWLFISTTPIWIAEKTKTKELDHFYFEYAPPIALGDTAMVLNHIKPVHDGLGLDKAYTGKGVVIGFVDQGIDWNHPDFIDANGNTRVLRYWDHSHTGASNSPYGYGIVWDSASINNGTCTSIEGFPTAHGTTVAGIGAGNARANGHNIGAAPESNIIIVESNFDLNNWTLTIADAIDYVFKVADSLNMPAVVNLSLGSYLGSHDGEDPAAEIIEDLLDAKPGRIVVGAAGNAGNIGKYHVQSNVTTDTSFVWMLNNGSSAFGANKIYFDLWSDTADADYTYAFQANLPNGAFNKRATTVFRTCNATTPYPMKDTLYNSLGQRIATIEIYAEKVGPHYHLEGYFNNVDSTNYYYGFLTTGGGKYDMWSGAALGLNAFVTNIPSVGVYPPIAHYVMPDTLQTIVSSWACSEKVITVGNYRNRYSFIDANGNVNGGTGSTLPGMLSVNSSKGPSRKNLVKPDVCATGDYILSASPLWLINDPSYWGSLDSGKWHAGNGGTSMASPCVAGSAALYLQKCRYANYQNFKNDLIGTAFSDPNTGALPNYAFGNGKLHAHNLLLSQSLNTAQPSLSFDGSALQASSAASYLWLKDGIVISGANTSSYVPQAPYGTYEVIALNSDGCPNKSLPITFTAGLNELQENNMVYPNPANQKVNILLDKEISKVCIIDMNGKEVLQKTGNVKEIDVSKIEKGSYILRIETNEGVIQSKFTKI